MNLLKEFDVKSSNYSTACEYIHVRQTEDDEALEDEKTTKRPAGDDQEASEYDNASRHGPKEAALESSKRHSKHSVTMADSNVDEKPKKMSLKGDRGSIVLLIFLYLLQGKPLF